MAIRDDAEDSIVVDDRSSNPMNWLVPLLMIPVFFIVGWVANDVLTPEFDSSQFGVGGGPVNPTTPTPYVFPTVPETTDSPTMSPTDTVTPTASPTTVPDPME